MTSSTIAQLAAGSLLLLSACADNDVRVSLAQRRGFASGTATEVALATPPASVRALTTVNGVAQVINATTSGTVAVLTGVANAPYILELRYPPPAEYPMDPPRVVQYPIDGARRVRIGDSYWARPDTTPFADTAKLTLNVSTATPLRTGDTLSWISLRSYFYRSVDFDPTAEGEPGVPADNASMTVGWTIPGDHLSAPYGSDASGLPSATRGDDLLLLHYRSESMPGMLDRYDPWRTATYTHVVGALSVTDANFDNTGPNAVRGTLAAPTTAMLSIDVRGSTFATIRESLNYPPAANATAMINVSQEAGTGPGYFTSIAPDSWSLRAATVNVPANPTCYPDERAECPDPSCDRVCDRTIAERRHPGDFTRAFAAPRAITTGMRDVFNVIYTYFLSWRHPTQLESVILSASATSTRPVSALSGPVSLEVGPVRDAMIDQESLAWTGTPVMVSAAPTIKFRAPAFGNPEYYVVTLIELFPDPAPMPGQGSARRSRVAAVFYTRSLSVTIPDGVLRPQKYYYARIAAVRDGRDFTAPDEYRSDTGHSTAVFTEVFSR